MARLKQCISGVISLRVHSDRVLTQPAHQAFVGLWLEFLGATRETRVLFSFSLPSRVPHVAPESRLLGRLFFTHIYALSPEKYKSERKSYLSTPLRCLQTWAAWSDNFFWFTTELNSKERLFHPLLLWFAFFHWTALVLMFFQAVKCLCIKQEFWVEIKAIFHLFTVKKSEVKWQYVT